MEIVRECDDDDCDDTNTRVRGHSGQETSSDVERVPCVSGHIPQTTLKSEQIFRHLNTHITFLLDSGL